MRTWVPPQTPWKKKKTEIHMIKRSWNWTWPSEDALKNMQETAARKKSWTVFDKAHHKTHNLQEIIYSLTLLHNFINFMLWDRLVTRSVEMKESFWPTVNLCIIKFSQIWEIFFQKIFLCLTLKQECQWLSLDRGG